MSTVWCERHDRAVPADRDRCFDCETELILRRAATSPTEADLAVRLERKMIGEDPRSTSVIGASRYRMALDQAGDWIAAIEDLGYRIVPAETRNRPAEQADTGTGQADPIRDWANNERVHLWTDFAEACAAAIKPWPDPADRRGWSMAMVSLADRIGTAGLVLGEPTDWAQIPGAAHAYYESIEGRPLPDAAVAWAAEKREAGS